MRGDCVLKQSLPFPKGDRFFHLGRFLNRLLLGWCPLWRRRSNPHRLQLLPRRRRRPCFLLLLDVEAHCISPSFRITKFPSGRINRCGARVCSIAVQMCPCVVSPSSSRASHSGETRRPWTGARTRAGQRQRCGWRFSTPSQWAASTPPRTEAGCVPSTTSPKVPCRTPSCTASAGPALFARSIGRFITAASALSLGAPPSPLPLSNNTS